MLLPKSCEPSRCVFQYGKSLNKKKSLEKKYNKLINNEQEGLFSVNLTIKTTPKPIVRSIIDGPPDFSMFGVEKFDVVIGNRPMFSGENQGE